jgi:hypothetical protein
LIKSIFTSANTKFPKPLFLTYFNTSFFVLYLIPAAIRYGIAKVKAQNRAEFVSSEQLAEVSKG